jgi:tRNA (guanine6-N2)-methyltransferase
MEPFVEEELRTRFRRGVTILPSLREGLVPILLDGELGDLLHLDTALAVYGERRFAVPRPQALLGHAAFTTLLSMIEIVRDLHPPGAFQTVRLSAAGADSPVLVRYRTMIADATGLRDVADEGNLLIRLRRPLDGSDGWDVLIRLSPRPLSVRGWRVCNLSGALNATAAQAMVRLSRPHPDDAVLNLACGSATLLIERLRLGPARIVMGCDTDAAALGCAARNVEAAGFNEITLADWDAGNLPLPPASVDTALADLPFGQVVGSHAANLDLYPRLLAEAARVVIGGGTFAAITQDIRLWERVVAQDDRWTTETVVPLKIPIERGYIHPRIFLLRRT